MKVVVEFDLPEGQAIPDPRDIVRLTDPNWLSEWWHIDDVIEQAEPDYQLTEEEEREVLKWMEKWHDCNVGHSWDSMDNCINQVIKQRKKVA